MDVLVSLEEEAEDVEGMEEVFGSADVDGTNEGMVVLLAEVA